jgi:DNA-binding HxlR family transcriptional regulator
MAQMSASDELRKKAALADASGSSRSVAARVRRLPMRASAPLCAADIVIQVLRGRWKTTILKCIAGHGTLHFGALTREIPGISHKVLTRQLRDLEHDGILHRQVTAKSRPETHYSLTQRGRDLQAVLDSLAELAARWQAES